MAKTSLGTLYVDLLAKTAGFETDLGRAAKIADKRAKEIDKKISALGKTIGVGLAAAATTAAVSITRAVNEMDNLGKTAQKIGISVEALSGLQYAAELSDVSLEQLQGGMTRLIRTMADAASGGEKQQAVFEALGVAYTTATGELRAGDSVFRDVVASLSGMEDGAQKTALVLELFGRSGADLIPLINAGADGIDRMTEEARKLGLVISQEAAANAEKFNDSLTTLGRTVDGVGLQVAEKMLPAMNDLIDRVTKAANDPAFTSGLATAITGIGDAALWTAQQIANVANATGFLFDEARARAFQQFKSGDITRMEDEIQRLNKALDGGILDKRIKIFKDGKIFEVVSDEEIRRERDELQARVDKAYQDIQAKPVPSPAAAPPAGGNRPGNPFVPPPDGSAERVAREAERERQRQAKKAAREMEDRLREQQALFEDVQHVKFSLMSQEEQAVARLQAEYINLQNAIAAGAITSEEGASVAADLAARWAEEQKAYHEQALDYLSSGLLTEEEEIQKSYERRREAILAEMALTEQEKTDLLVRAEKDRADKQAQLEQERQMMVVSSATSIAASLASITKDSMGEQSKAYRVMFAISKGFAVAEAAVALAQNIANASKIGFPQNLPMIAGAVAQGAQIMSILSGAQYSGAYDKGGVIPAGSVGLVGEIGPELVAGPATVTGRAQTASMLRSAQDRETKIRIISITDAQNAADYLSSDPGEQNILAIADRNRAFFKQLVAS